MMKTNTKLFLALIGSIILLVGLFFVFQLLQRNIDNDLSVTDKLRSPEYMAGCKSINPIKASRQAGFQTIYPGITLIEDVKSKFGEPKKISNYKNEIAFWEYDNFSLSYLSLSGKIDEVLVFADAEMNTLIYFVKKYGCPELIYAFDVAEEPAGDFNTLFMYYGDTGLELFFHKFPITLDEKTWTVNYSKPMTIDEYLITYSPILGIENKIKIVSWDEAVK